MSHEPFTHDAGQFIPVAAPHGVDVSDVEAKYADLFAEVIWDGLITPEKRQQLRTAAEIFGLAADRSKQIEQALLAAHEAHHRLAVVEQSGALEDAHASDHPSARRGIEPLVRGEDPRVQVLCERIEALEREQARLVAEGERLRQQTEQLEQVAQELQVALVSSTTQLEQAQARLAEATAKAKPGAKVGASAKPSGGGEARPRIRSRRPLAQRAPAPAASPEANGTAVAPALGPAASPEANRPVVAPAPAIATLRNDPTELHQLLQTRPRDADLLHALFLALERADDLDRRWCIAHVLAYLGEANDRERATFCAQADGSLVRPTRAINEDEWHELLFHPDEDRLTGEILGEIAPAVLLGHMTAMRASLAPELIDPMLQVDPKQSNEQAVRCLAWAAAALGTKLPPVFVCRDLDVTADIVLNPKPTTRLGRKALSGRTTRELAFLAGQHLTWYRKEHLLGKPSTSVRRLEDMFVAALLIGNPALPITPEIKQRAEPIERTIRPLLGEAGVARLQRAFTRFAAHGTNLVRWLEAVQRTAACAGLLLANDLACAESVLRLDGEPRLDVMMDELMVFFTSGRCSLLRKRIGIAVGE